jgi:hypothetical protein
LIRKITAVICRGLRFALLLEFLGGLSERDVGWHGLKVTSNFILLHGNGFEEQSLTVHVHVQKGDLPMPRRDFRLLDVKCAALIEMAEQSAVKFDRPNKMTLDLRQPVLSFVNPDPPSMA